MRTENKARKSLDRRKLGTCNCAECRFSLIPLNSPVSCFGKVSAVRQIRDAEYTLAPWFVPLSGLMAELGRAGCNETIVERKNEKEFLACLRNRDRAGPKFTLRQCTRRLSAPETVPCALSFRLHFLFFPLPPPLSFFLFASFFLRSFRFYFITLDGIGFSRQLLLRNRRIPRRRASLRAAIKNGESLRRALVEKTVSESHFAN